MSRQRGLGLVTERVAADGEIPPTRPWVPAQPLPSAHAASSLEPMAVVLDVVRDAAGLSALEAEWRELWRRSSSVGRTFLTFDWVSLWCAVYAARPDVRLAIVTVRHHGCLVAVWPLVERRIGRLRQLKWIGEPASQYHDVLAAPADDLERVLLASWHGLVARLAPHHVCLRKVRADAMVSPVLAAVGARVVARDAAPSLQLADAPSAEAYELRYPARERKNRRRLLRRLEEMGPVETAAFPAGATAGALVARAIDLKRQWARRRGAFSRALTCVGLEPFLVALAARESGDVACRVGVLSVAGEPASIQLAFREGDRLLMHVIAYDDRFERAGVGALHIESTLRDSFHEGVATLDLLAPADAYKRAWADTETEVRDYAHATGTFGRLLDWVYDERARGRLKKALERLPDACRIGLARLVAQVRRRARPAGPETRR
jgi:CelD/BcsL family acetyltransferase involved in cellulose biosynthesis